MTQEQVSMRIVQCIAEFEVHFCQTSRPSVWQHECGVSPFPRPDSRASRLDSRTPDSLMNCLLFLGKPELKGFNLNPLNEDELKALKVILKG